MISLSSSSPVPMPSWNTTPPVGGSLRVQLNETDAFSNNMIDWILSINPGDIIYIRQHDDNTNYAYYKVDSYIGTFSSSGQVYDVTHIESNSVGNGSNWDGKQFDVGFIPAGPAGGGFTSITATVTSSTVTAPTKVDGRLINGSGNYALSRSVFLPGGNGSANSLPANCNSMVFLETTVDLSAQGGTSDQKVYIPCYF